MRGATARFSPPYDSKTASTEDWHAKNECHLTAYRGLRQDKYAVYSRGVVEAVNRIKPLRPKTAGAIWETLPAALTGIRRLIEASRSVLDLSPNWDGENAKPIEERTWKRAAQFLSRYARRLWQTEGKVIDPPDITPVPDGTIDIHWDRPEFELLVNITCGDSNLAEFYGDDRGSIAIRGEFDLSRLSEGLIHWLLKS